MNAKPFLVLSVILNLALIGAVAWLGKARPNPLGASSSATPQAPATAATPVSKTERASLSPAPPKLLEAAKAGQSFDWRMVESEDYKKYITNLRSIGCPEETIRDIITADVNKLFESRKRNLHAASTNKFQYWKTGNIMAGMLDEEKIKQSQELAKEKRELLKELLGVEPEEKPDLFAGFNPFESMLDFLPATKQGQIAEIYQKYQTKLMKSFGSGTPDSEDMKKLQNTQKEMEADMAKILTPQELEDYQLRMSQTAMIMRMQLGSFDASEQEFRDIFKLKKTFDDDYGALSMFGVTPQDKAEKEKYNAAKKEMETQLKGVLGNERFADYERSQDFAYQGIYKVTERNGLDKSVAIQIYDMKKAAEEQAKNVRQDNSLTKDQQKTALQGIRSETETAIRGVMGDKPWQSYQNQQSAYWIRGISPDPK